MKEQSPFDLNKALSQGRDAARLAQKERARLLTVLGGEQGNAILSRLEARFETHLPAFQGKAGEYDALDAMRRDAHREVFLYIRCQLELARKENQPNQEI